MCAKAIAKTYTVCLDLGNTVNCMQVSKGMFANLVLQSHEFVVVVDQRLTVRGTPFIKLAKEMSSSKEAYDEWLRVIGKLCKKDIMSKYFSNPKFDEHLNNGKFREQIVDTIVNMAEMAVLTANNMNA